MFLPRSPTLAASHLVTNIFRDFRKGFCGTFPFDHSQRFVLFLLLCPLFCDSFKSTLAATVPTATTGCGVSEECSSEQLFEDCHSRGTTESLLCYCSNGVPRTCRNVCDSSEAPDACPPQCQGYLSCKAYSNLAADEGWNAGWVSLVAVVVFVVLASIVAVLVVRHKRSKEGMQVSPCCARTRSTGKPESSNNHRAVVGANMEEEMTHGLQETRQPGIQSSSPVVPSDSPPEPESAALLVNS